MTVKWTKTYAVNAPGNKNFKIFLSEGAGGLYSASCLWYEGGRALKAPGESGGLEFKLENFAGTSEEEAFTKAQEWVVSKFGSETTVSDVT